ncbi:hypothetical protein [Nitratifractor sp.]
MKRWLPILVSLLVAAGAGWFVYQKRFAPRQTQAPAAKREALDIGHFAPMRPCGRMPAFLRRLGVTKLVLIDLSQQRFKGVAFLYGPRLRRVVYAKRWGRYDYFSTYALDPRGNLYLAPMPFISITPHTFNLQNKIFRLESKSGKLGIWMTLDDVNATARNPYGVIALNYDCDDGTLWVSAIDGSDYRAQRGRIYHIDPKGKRMLQKTGGFDALTLKVLKTSNGKYLLAGSARENALYAYRIENGRLIAPAVRLLSLPDPEQRIRKIRIVGSDTLVLETIPFRYSLVAQSGGSYRHRYRAKRTGNGWEVVPMEGETLSELRSP